MLSASGGVWELLDEIPDCPEGYEDGLCECGEDVTAVMEIDSGDLLISCSTCGKNLLPLDDYDLVFMDPVPVNVECFQEHHHNWDTVGCDCNFYWELKTKVPHD